MRFNPHEVRLNIGKLEKLGNSENWNFEMLLVFKVYLHFCEFSSVQFNLTLRGLISSRIKSSRIIPCEVKARFNEPPK